MRDRDAGGSAAEVLAAEGKLRALNEKLRHARSPHVCRYQIFEIRSSLAYMVRPYVYSTLFERAQVCGLCCLPQVVGTTCFHGIATSPMLNIRHKAYFIMLLVDHQLTCIAPVHRSFICSVICAHAYQ
jgi:hypothetical protein